MSERDGGPAFPVPYGARHSGMSLRDWFAGLALQGLLAEAGTYANFDEPAKDAYEAADAMLKAWRT